MRIGLIVLKFLLIGALFILANENIHLSNPVEREGFYSRVYDWLDTLYQQSLGVVGYVAKSEWLPNEANPIEPPVDQPIG
ncbi:MAG: hypothetical protein ABH864_03110 [archaeon]